MLSFQQSTLTGLVTDTFRHRSPRPCCKPAGALSTYRSLFRAYPMRVYCCDFQSSKLRKHSEVGLGLTYNVAALRLLGLVNLRLKKQLLLKPPPLGGGD